MGILSRNWKPIFLFFLGPALSSIFAHWFFQIRPTVENPLEASQIGVGIAITLAITFTASILGFTITISEISNSVKKKIDETKDEFIIRQGEQLKSRVKIVELTGREVDSSVLERIKDANLVRNTYVNLAEKMSRIPNLERDSVAQYNSFLSKDARHWIDVTTIQDMSLGRFRDIKPERIGVGTRHEVSIIESSTDIINFLLIDKKNKPSDLYFGWVNESGEYFRVFWTNDSAMLEIFSVYFSSLLASSVEHIEIDYKNESRYIAKSDALLGRWVCVPQIDRMNKITRFKSYSVVDISIIGGRWVIRSDVYNKDSSRIIRVIESESAISQSGSVFFEGTSRSVGGTQKTITFGQFKLAPDYDDMMIGTYVAEDAKTVSRLFAYRVENTFSVTDFESVKPFIQKIIEQEDLVNADDWRLVKG